MVQFNQHTQKLNEFDQKLAELERETRQTEEQRREYVNRNNLNKTFDGYTKGRVMRKVNIAVRALFLPLIVPVVLIEALLEWIDENSHAWYWFVKSFRIKFHKWLDKKLPV